MDTKNKHSSWMCDDLGCTDCGYPIVVTQSEKADYYWYCSNKYCNNHKGEETGDMERPEWVKPYND